MTLDCKKKIKMQQNGGFLKKKSKFAIYWSATKIDGRTVGTITQARFKLEQRNKKN